MQILNYRIAKVKPHPFSNAKMHHCYRTLIGLKKYTILFGLNPSQASELKAKIKVELIEEKTDKRIKKIIDFSKIDFTKAIEKYAKIKKPTKERKRRIAPNLSSEQERVRYSLARRSF